MLILPALAVVLALGACGLGADDAGLDGEWVLQSGSHDGPLPLLPDRAVTMRIAGTEIGGSAACNIYGGTIERDGTSVRIGALSMTEMGCDEPSMALEAAFLAALADVTTAERADMHLVLRGPSVELAFTLAVPESNARLVGTAWTLESLVSGDAVASVVDGAGIELAADGTLRGTTGCRHFEGGYEADGTELRITDLVVEDVACDDVDAAQDTHVLEVLDGPLTVSIEGSRLSLRRGAVGLDYLAGS
jgi:heat shock protein HslJ